MADEVQLADAAAQKLRLTSDQDTGKDPGSKGESQTAAAGSAAARQPTGVPESAPSDRHGTGDTSVPGAATTRTPGKSVPGTRGAASASERTRQLASTKLPPGLQAKLEAVRRVPGLRRMHGDRRMHRLPPPWTARC